MIRTYLQLLRGFSDRNGVTEKGKNSPNLHGDFEKYKLENVLVICDIEGGELELLDMTFALASAI